MPSRMGHASHATSLSRACLLGLTGTLLLTGAACLGPDTRPEGGEGLREGGMDFVGLFEHIQHVRVMREGFQEISADWDAFANQWAFADPVAFDAHEREAMVLHSTEEELRDLYTFRASFYERLAADSVRNVACGPDRTIFDVMMILADLRTEANMRQVGRALARQHEGGGPWNPPVPVPTADEHRDAFLQYLLDTGETEVAEILSAGSERAAVTDADLCRAQSLVFARAANRPNDRVGELRVFDYVRSLEALDLQPMDTVR
jgi:hypothetical protein